MTNVDLLSEQEKAALLTSFVRPIRPWVARKDRNVILVPALLAIVSIISITAGNILSSEKLGTSRPTATIELLCRNALNSDHSGWDQSPRYLPSVQEATRRGLTITSCRQVLGLPVGAQPPIAPPIQPSPLQPAQTTEQLCGYALNSDRNGWDQSPPYLSSVQEAIRRGLTIASCRQTLGLAPSSPTAPPIPQPPPAQTLNNEKLCEDALNNEQSGWDQSPPYLSSVQEAIRRGLTIATCRQALGLPPAPQLPTAPPIAPSNNDLQLRQRTAEFLNVLYREISSPNSDALVAANDDYADRVNYFGKSYSHEQVIAELQSFYDRWPIRRYEMRGSLGIDCEVQSLTCTTKGLLDFDARSPDRNQRSWGLATFGYVLKFVSSTTAPKIIQEAGEVTERHSEALSTSPPSGNQPVGLPPNAPFPRFPGGTVHLPGGIVVTIPQNPQNPGIPQNPGRSHTWNGCRPNWTIQGGVCKPYRGGR